jgi:hypothetical protein
MITRLPRQLPAPDAAPDAPVPGLAALLALCPGDEPPDERLRALLMELRRARVAEIRAIESYLGLGPARSERGRGG